MKKHLCTLLASAVFFSLVGCSKNTSSSSAEAASAEESPNSTVSTEAPQSEAVSESTVSSASNSLEINASPDKYTWYIKNYVGKNCASIGYTSMGGDRLDTYGAGYLELIFVTPDGSYLDINSDNALQEYMITSQNLEPNTEIKLEFSTDSDGNEYDNLVSNQNYDEIVLGVKKVGDADTDTPVLTTINAAPDRYTRYISDYVGRNLASCGYVSMGGDLIDAYGQGYIKIIAVPEDGSYVDISDEEAIKNYVVTGQSIAPNTALTYQFMTDSDGNEYDNLIDQQSFEEIELNVRPLTVVSNDDTEQAAAEPLEEAAAAESAETEDAETEDAELVDGMRPDFKEAMDSYEAFYDQYCDFLMTYNENPSDLTLLAEYADLVIKAQKMDEKFDAWEAEDLNDVEAGYYLEVNGRVLQKLAKVA